MDKQVRTQTHTQAQAQQHNFSMHFYFLNFIACLGKHKWLQDLPLAHQKPLTQNTKRQATEA